MENEYYGFISYSTNDKNLTRAIHRCLERLHIPKGQSAEKVTWIHKNRIRPVFLDRLYADLGPKHYNDTIFPALERSRWLIVICSRNSAISKPVDNEIKHFLKYHSDGLRRIIPVIIEGNPWSSSAADKSCLPPSLVKHWDEIRTLNMPAYIALRNTSPPWRKYLADLAVRALQETNISTDDTPIQRGWRQAAGAFFEDALIRPQKIVAQEYAIQIAAYMLAASYVDLSDELWKEEKTRFRTRVAIAIAALLAMLGLVQWAVYEKQIGNTHQAYNLALNARKGIEQGKISEGLAYLGSSLGRANLPEARHLLQSLLLQESWLIPTEASRNTLAVKDRSAFDAQVYNRAITSMIFAAYGKPVSDDPPMPVAILPSGAEVHWSLSGTLQRVAKDGTTAPLATARPDHTLIPIGLFAANTRYAFAETPLNDTTGRGEVATYVHTRSTATWEIDGILPIRGTLRGLATSEQSEYIFVMYGIPPSTQVWLAAFKPEATKPIWQTQVPSTSRELRVSPDGKNVLLIAPTVAETHSDVRLLLFDAYTGRQNETLLTSLPLSHVEFSPDGQRVAVVDEGNTLRLLDVHAPGTDVVMPLLLPSRPGLVCFSADGRKLCIVNKKSTQWYNIQIAPPLLEHTSTMAAGIVHGMLALPHDDALVLVLHNAIEIWSTTGERLSVPLPYSGQYPNAALSPDGTVLALAGSQRPNVVTLVDIRKQPDAAVPYSLQERPPLTFPMPTTAVMFHPRKNMLLVSDFTGSAKGKVYLCDLTSFTAKPTLLQTPEDTYGALFSPDGEVLLTLGDGLHTWSTDSQQKAPHIWDTEQYAANAWFNPNGELLVAVDREIRYFNKSKLLWNLYLNASCDGAAFSPDSKTLVVSSGRRDIRAVETQTGKSIGVGTRTGAPIRSMAILNTLTTPLLFVSTTSPEISGKWEQGDLELYTLDADFFAWKTMPLAANIHGFLTMRDRSFIPWNSEGFFKAIGFSLLGAEEDRSRYIAEALGAWRMDENNRLQPASQSLQSSAVTLASSPEWRIFLQWLQTPVEERSQVPGGRLPLKQFLGGMSEKDSFAMLQAVLRIDPAHEGALSRMWWKGALHAGAQSARDSAQSHPGSGDTAQAAEARWREQLQNKGASFLYTFPAPATYADFWSRRAVLLHPDSPDALTARILFLFHTENFTAAQEMVKNALARHPEHPGLLEQAAKLSALLPSSAADTDNSLAAARKALRQQKPLPCDDLLRNNFQRIKSTVRIQAIPQAAIADDLIEDVKLCFGARGVAAFQNDGLTLEDGLISLADWPVARAMGYAVLEKIVALNQADQLPQLDPRRVESLHLLKDMYSLFLQHPFEAFSAKGLPDKADFMLPRLLLTAAILHERTQPESGNGAFARIVDRIQSMPQPDANMDALTLLYAMQFRGIAFSPAIAEAQQRLEEGLSESLHSGRVCILAVTPNSPGDKAGLRAGDRLVQYNGVPVLSSNIFIGERMVQGEGELAVLRDNKPLTISVPEGMLGIQIEDD